jgi:hypothetical protein
MADIKFACPSCSQHITCDELWGGHQIECPSCKQSLAVPAQPAPSAGASGGLVPKPPSGAEPRLSINAGHSAAPTPGAAQPQRTIPIRNLVPPKTKKKSALVTYGVAALVLAVLGAGGYYGYGWYMERQNRAANADAAGQGSKTAADARQRRGSAAPEDAANATGDAAAAATNTESAALIPAVWNLDLAKAKVPSGRANGSLGGTNFVPQSARIDPVGAAQVLRLIEGQPVSPDREVLIYLHLKPGEKLGGQTLNVSQDMAGAGVPQVTKRWKTNPKFAPQYKSFSSGYAMHLELGQAADGVVPGKIFLALPDPTQTVLGGSFKASVITNAVTDTVQAVTPVAAPAMAPSTTADAAWQARYGNRRAR